MQTWGCELPKPMGNSRVLCCMLATPKQKAEAGASPGPWAAWPSQFSKPQDSEKPCHNKHGGWFLRNNSWSCPLASTITRTHMSACVHTRVRARTHTHIDWQDFLSLMWRFMGKHEPRKWLEVGACITSASKKSAVKDACRQLDDLERWVSLKKNEMVDLIVFWQCLYRLFLLQCQLLMCTNGSQSSPVAKFRRQFL